MPSRCRTMGDSEDEYDRRRRDKFRKERSDYQERRDDRGRREEWIDRRDSWNRERNRRDYREYDARRRDRYSPPPRQHDLSPPMKRIRRGDWDDRAYSSYDVPSYGSGGMVSSHQGWGPSPEMSGSVHSQHAYGGHSGRQREQDNGPTQPPMMTFKQFLTSQDDTISDEEAVKKYNEYKQEFRRQQLNDFFINHKEEEWFKSKYHPEEYGKRQADQLAGLKHRLQVFMEINEKSEFSKVSIDAEKADEIVKILDAVVIKLEGGTDNDLKILDQSFEEFEKNEKVEMLIPDKKEEESKKEKSEKTKSPEKDEKKRKRNKEFKFDEGEESGSDTESEGEATTPDEVIPSGNENNAADEDKKPDSIKEDEENDGEVKDDENSNPADESKLDTSGEASENGVSEKATADASVPENPESLAPRPLHRTCSIFLRNLAPSITKQEVEAMCKRYPGFLRVAIADPQPERRFFRRGWVTFERGVNIKEICWNLNNIRLRDCELGAIVNRDLTRRIRTVNGITSHKQVVRADVKLAAKMIQNLDSRYELWIDDSEVKDNSSMNPLLKNITDYLIEEASAEEEELLGTAGQDEKAKDTEGSETTLERDETLIQVLDRLLLYLRIVHSVDYYNHSDYPNEDEMPNRCGIMHARGPSPSNKVTIDEVNEYINNFEQKVQVFLQPLTKLGDEEALKLGKKDPDAEVQKFIQANTQELAKDKWLCPLSGKKFKGPEFVRKHIHNKHAEKIEEVKKEVEYFNKYLMDPKRPQLPEHPGNKPQGNSTQNRSDNYSQQASHNMQSSQYGYGAYGQGSRGPMGMPLYQGALPDPGMYSSQNYGRGNYNDSYRSGSYYSQKRGRDSGRRDPRGIIQYRDLDAPDVGDVF